MQAKLAAKGRVESERRLQRALVLRSAAIVLATLSGGANLFSLHTHRRGLPLKPPALVSAGSGPFEEAVSSARIRFKHVLIDEVRFAPPRCLAKASLTQARLAVDPSTPGGCGARGQAAQAIEPACLIPLKYGAERLVLVGDPRQLPATVKSTTAAQFGLERSLFERLEEAGCAAASKS